MCAATRPTEAEGEMIDHAALRLMLSYVEAECLRIGATEAARHAALAAASMPVTGSKRSGVGPGVVRRRPRTAQLH